MKKDIGDHLISKLDLQDIAKVLSDELSGSELNTVLLDIFNKRVQQETPSSLLSKYEGNKLVKPALLEDVLEYKENELLFLHDKRVPANNSLCERLARVYKRKQKQAITLRSQESLNDICDGLSIVYLLRSQNVDVYQKISEIYERKRPPKIKQEKANHL